MVLPKSPTILLLKANAFVWKEKRSNNHTASFASHVNCKYGSFLALQCKTKHYTKIIQNIIQYKYNTKHHYYWRKDVWKHNCFATGIFDEPAFALVSVCDVTRRKLYHILYVSLFFFWKLFIWKTSNDSANN